MVARCNNSRRGIEPNVRTNKNRGLRYWRIVTSTKIRCRANKAGPKYYATGGRSFFLVSRGGGGEDDSVNVHTAVSEKMCHERLDALSKGLRLSVTLTGALPGLIKADVDAAYRRIPVCAKHRWACGIAYALSGQVLGIVSVTSLTLFPCTFEAICPITFRVTIRSNGARARMGKNSCSYRTFGTAFLANRNLALCG